jgi:hypothetical protein
MAKFFGGSFSQRHRIVDLNSGAHRARPKYPEYKFIGPSESGWVGLYREQYVCMYVLLPTGMAPSTPYIYVILIYIYIL